jgi:nucleoside diphosphate kinase
MSRSLFGTDIVRNAVHGSILVENAIREIDILFQTRLFALKRQQ